MAHRVHVIDTEYVTHNVRRFKFERPAGFDFEPGQATEVSIDREGWRDEKRPFTFTGLRDWDHLEFTIKIYSDHDGVTNQLGSLKGQDLGKLIGAVLLLVGCLLATITEVHNYRVPKDKPEQRIDWVSYLRDNILGEAGWRPK